VRRTERRSYFTVSQALLPEKKKKALVIFARPVAPGERRGNDQLLAEKSLFVLGLIAVAKRGEDAFECTMDMATGSMPLLREKSRCPRHKTGGGGRKAEVHRHVSSTCHRGRKREEGGS